MRYCLVLHAVLLVGSIVLLSGLDDKPPATVGNDEAMTSLDPEASKAGQDIQEPPGWRSGDIGGGEKGAAAEENSAALLNALRKEQALLRDELRQLRAQQSYQQRQAIGAGNCSDAGDNAPGVTVFLETTPAQSRQPSSPMVSRQWTALSFREIGQAPDGSRQAVMSIHELPARQAGQGGGRDFVPMKAAAGKQWPAQAGKALGEYPILQ